MSNPAQDEVDALFAQQGKKQSIHPEDAIHPGHNSDAESENDSTVYSHDNNNDDDDDTLASQTTTAMPPAAYYIPNDTNFNANTGPKGVIADARSFEKARKRSFRQTLQAISRSVLELPREKSSSPTSDLSTDEEEDEFMRTWRESRMQELQTAGSDIRTRRQSPSKRVFGNCDVVDALGYLDALDKLPPDTMVVVCIYDNESAISGMVEDALQALARKHVTVRFIKIHYLEAEMPEISVPGVLAYFNGELTANLVSVLDEFPEGRDLNSSSMETLLKQHKVLF